MAAVTAPVGAPKDRFRRYGTPATQIGGALAIGAATPILAYYVGNLAAVGACAAVALVALTLARPEIGIAAWFVMVPLGKTGQLVVGPEWLLSTAWAVFLFFVAITRSTSQDHGSGSEVAAERRTWRARLPPL